MVVMRCIECGSVFFGYTCPKCCEHEFDWDEGYTCLDCGMQGDIGALIDAEEIRRGDR